MVELLKVQERLSEYLGARVAELRVLASGWETTVFELVLGSPTSRAEVPVGVPLVLRFYQGGSADEKGVREYEVIRRLADAQFIVPFPYLFEPNAVPLG